MYDRAPAAARASVSALRASSMRRRKRMETIVVSIARARNGSVEPVEQRYGNGGEGARPADEEGVVPDVLVSHLGALELS